MRYVGSFQHDALQMFEAVKMQQAAVCYTSALQIKDLAMLDSFQFQNFMVAKKPFADLDNLSVFQSLIVALPFHQAGEL